MSSSSAASADERIPQNGLKLTTLKRYASLASLSFKENFMSRSLLRPAVAAAAAALSVLQAHADESYTTRIEPATLRRDRHH